MHLKICTTPVCLILKEIHYICWQTYLFYLSSELLGDPVPQYIKHCYANLVVQGSRLDEGGDLSNLKLGYIAHSLSFSTSHSPDVTEILLTLLHSERPKLQSQTGSYCTQPFILKIPQS